MELHGRNGSDVRCCNAWNPRIIFKIRLMHNLSRLREVCSNYFQTNPLYSKTCKVAAQQIVMHTATTFKKINTFEDIEIYAVPMVLKIATTADRLCLTQYWLAPDLYLE